MANASLVMSQCTKLWHQQQLERRNVIAKLIYGEFAEEKHKQRCYLARSPTPRGWQ